MPMIGTNWIQKVQESYDLPKSVAEQIVMESARRVNAARQQQAEIEKARSLPYKAWLDTEKSDPTMRWDFSWIDYFLPYLQAVADGDIRWLICNIPPRTGKTNLITIRFPVFWMERNPTHGVILGSYGGGLASDFAQESMRIYKLRNPQYMGSESKEKWTNIFGGFEYPIGVGGGVTGRGAELILVDDPVKSWAEATSKAYMDLVWYWFLNDLRKRRNNDNVPILIVHTRWSDDDLTGRLMNSPEARDWTRIAVPALAMTQAERDQMARRYGQPLGQPDPLGREPGEAILPERFPAESLLLEQKTDPQGFASLNQQVPIQLSLASFKTEKFEIIPEAPVNMHRVRYWDSAATPGGGDYTVGVLMGITEEGRIIVEDVVRGQWAEEDVDRIMRRTAILDNYKYGSFRRQNPETIAKMLGMEQDTGGEEPDLSAWIDQDRLKEAQQARYRYSMKTWIEQEPAASGKKVANYRKRVVMMGIDVASETARDSKGVRARPWASSVNSGNASLVLAPWNHEYIQEHQMFVIGVDDQMDDQVDASSGAYIKLTVDLLIVSIR
jgi:phage terminase large subunit-like protein